MTQKAFHQCGISVYPNGSEDHLIKIKDIASEKIDFTGWENAKEITIKEEAEVDRLEDDQEYVGTDDVVDFPGYYEMTGKVLQEMLRAPDLKVSGAKKDLVQE